MEQRELSNEARKKNKTEKEAKEWMATSKKMIALGPPEWLTKYKSKLRFTRRNRNSVIINYLLKAGQAVQIYTVKLLWQTEIVKKGEKHNGDTRITM